MPSSRQKGNLNDGQLVEYIYKIFVNICWVELPFSSVNRAENGRIYRSNNKDCPIKNIVTDM
jgi:hypothetical protein